MKRLFAAALVASFFTLAASAAAATQWVNDDAPAGSNTSCDDPGYNTIGDAVAAAVDGDTIQVCEGTYGLASTISVDKSVAILGPNAGNDPTGGGARVGEAIVGSASASTGLRVRDVDVTVAGLTFTGFSSRAIWFNGADTADGLTIEHNVFTGNGQAFATSQAAASFPNVLSDLSFVNNLITSNSVRAVSHYTGVRGTDFTVSGNEFIDALVPMHFGFVDGLTVADNSVQMSDPYYAILIADDLSNVDITGNLLDGNDTAFLGLYVYPDSNVTGPVTVSGNEVTNFLWRGIDIRDNVDATQFSINENNITGNVEYGIRNIGEGTADGTCNWWGAADGPSGEGPGSGDAVSEGVSYTPWLTAPAPGGACEGVPPNPPASKADCKKGGWMAHTDDQGRSFKNQGDCVSYVATGGRNPAAG